MAFFEEHNLSNSAWPIRSGRFHRVSTYTEFFRYPNIEQLASDASAGQLPTGLDGVLHIAEPACSTGQETWSLAAALAIRGVDFHIDASDINPLVLNRAQGFYRVDKEDTSRISEHGVESFLPVNNGTLIPSDYLRARVTFEEADFAEDPLDYAKYGAVIVNTLFSHYIKYDTAVQKMIENIAHGIIPGGSLYTSSNLSRFPIRAYQLAASGLRLVSDPKITSRCEQYRYEPTSATGL